MHYQARYIRILAFTFRAFVFIAKTPFHLSKSSQEAEFFLSLPAKDIAELAIQRLDSRVGEQVRSANP